MAFYMDALEVLRQLVVAIGSGLFLDSLSNTYEKMAPTDCKAKGQKIYYHKIRPPNLDKFIVLMGHLLQ